MKHCFTRTMRNLTLSAVTLVLSATAAQAQFYKLHNADLGVGATGQFTTPLKSGGPAKTGTTDSTGFLLTLRDHPVSWAGVELNYQYTKLSERYRYPVAGSPIIANASIQTGFHEATAAYLFHPHMPWVQPFVALGGGAIDFNPVDRSGNQWRGTGLVEVGMDLTSKKNPHIGFRVQGRTLIYRAPNFQTARLQSRTWVATSQPSVGVYYRW
ncbi:MAG TPA: hypothetical protein VGB94_03315 [Acidobacteriaceae bacterium]